MLGVLKQTLGRAVDVAGRVEGDGGVRGQGLRLTKGQHMVPADRGHARPHQAGGAFRTDHLSMRRQVVEVSVGDKRAGDRMMRIKPPIELRQPDPVFILNIPSHAVGGKVSRFSRKATSPQPVRPVDAGSVMIVRPSHDLGAGAASPQEYPGEESGQ